MARSLAWKGLETFSLPFAAAGAVCLSAANAVFTNAGPYIFTKNSLLLHIEQVINLSF